MIKQRKLILLVATRLCVLALLVCQPQSAYSQQTPADSLSPSTAAKLVVPPAVLQAEQHRIEVINRVASSVVAVFAPKGAGGGSGVLISSDGFAVTNFHVVQGLGGFMKCGLNDGKVYDAVLVGIDPTGDVAVIKLLGRDDFPFAEVGDSDTVRMGDWTFAMGNPFLLADDFQPTVTYGMVSGTHRYQYPAGTFLEYTDCIQVDTSINPGNSGGPLFNDNGQLIGINGRISVEKRGRVNVGAGYSISINQVMHFLDHLKSGRIVDHATLGATVTNTAEGTVVVARILDTSEAYRRGLRQGDELISFAGRPVRSVNQFKNILGIYPKGWTVPLSFQRNGKRFNVTIQLASLHRQAELSGGGSRPAPNPDNKKNKLPIPIPHLDLKKKPTVPEEYLKLYEKKDGYANFYFNSQMQSKLLKVIGQFGDYQSQPRMWAIDLKNQDGEPLQIRMQPNAIAAKFANKFAVLELSEEYTAVPIGSGGLLASLEQLKQMLIDPRDFFTELYYVGSEPLDGTGERVDVLHTSKGLSSTRWYFSQANQSFVGFDTSIDDEHDACRIRIPAFKEISGVQFPTQFNVRSGTETWAILDVTSLNFLDSTAKGAP